MAYVRKIITQDETLIGIARLHWIYVFRGILWFMVFAVVGWALDYGLSHVIMTLTAKMDSPYIPLSLMRFSNGIMFFLLGGGFLIFTLFTMKVLFTEVALTSRRVIDKTGLFFVKVKQVDLEEIRGEHLDLGYFGRALGYGYLLLDCRFLGDVRLPAIENPERFLKALHDARSATPDALSVIVGGNPVPVDVVAAPPVSAEQKPDIQPAPPKPEIQPGQPGPHPETNPPEPAEVPTQPTPHAPPPAQQPRQPPGTVNAEVVAAVVPFDPKVIVQVVQQIMPQMAQQIVKEMSEQGLVQKEQTEEEDIDMNLVTSFDDARLKKDANGNDLHHKVEYAIH